MLSLGPDNMKISRFAVLKGVGWTVGAYGVGQLVRLLTNVVLARLLAPELFGIMVIVNSLRTGVDLISDVGIGQNIVQNKNADKADFYNTAWSLQLVRGLLLWGRLPNSRRASGSFLPGYSTGFRTADCNNFLRVCRLNINGPVSNPETAAIREIERV